MRPAEHGGPMDERGPMKKDELQSWKEISKYLNLNVRTCCRYENELGLPVHRIGRQKKSRVWASREELDRWLAETYSLRTRNGTKTDRKPQIGKQVRIESSVFRKRLGITVIGIAGLALLAGTAIVIRGRRPRIPDDFRIEKSNLLILNSKARVLGAFDTKISFLKPESGMKESFPNRELSPPPPNSARIWRYVIMKDIDGDGEREILFAPDSDDDVKDDLLYCLDFRGREIWHVKLGIPMEAGGSRFAPDFTINGLYAKDINGDGKDEILLIGHVRHEGATRILLIDTDGQAIGEYLHFGIISAFAFINIDDDPEPEIVLGGQNDDLERPCMIFLDAEDLARGNRDADLEAEKTSGNTTRIWRGIDADKQKTYIIFP
jgi:hypothetical protein